MSDESLGYTFLWYIENYANFWHNNGEELQSPYFTAEQLEGKSWWIAVYSRGKRDEDRGYVSVCLGRAKSDEGPETVSVNFELSVIAADGSTLRSEMRRDAFKKGTGFGWINFVNIKNVPHGTLTVRTRIWRGEGKVRRFAPVCARTRIAVENISFLQQVENFSALEPNEKKTIEIRSHSEKGFVVSSSLYFDDAGEIIVEIMSSDSKHNLCKRKISLLDDSGNIIACGESDNRLKAEGRDIRKLPLSLRREVILNKKSDYLPDDKLTLVFECVFSTGLEFSKIEKAQHETPKADVKQAGNPPPNQSSDNPAGKASAFPSSPETLHETPKADVKQAGNPPPNQSSDKTAGKASAFPNVVEDIKALYLNQRLTDVELKTKTKSFPAHKTVLFIRSPVFDAMMTNDMKEKNTCCIQVDDLEDDIVQQMLLFLYSDEIENLEWTMATRLYYASDKYQIGRLKEVCSSFLLEHLTPSNAGELLVLADDHSDSNLKRTVEEFILEHEKEVFGSKEWDMLMKTNPVLALTTMHLKYKR